VLLVSTMIDNFSLKRCTLYL